MKKFHKLSLTFLATILIIGSLITAVFVFNDKHAAGAGPTTLSGYAWSSTIGWISFNTSSPVTQDQTTGYLTGYAWSSNVGWIKFGGLSGMPSGGNGTGSSNARLLVSGTAFQGWFRVCAGMDDQVTPPPDQTSPNNNCSGVSRSDGWDGWVSLKGRSTPGNATYGVTKTSTPVPGNPGAYYLSGYAWGSDVVGWVDMSRVYIGGDAALPPPTPNLNVNLQDGTGCTYDAVLTWNQEASTTYAIKKNGTLLNPPGASYVGSQWTDTGLTPNTTYTYLLTATNTGGSANSSSTVTTDTQCPLAAPLIGSFTAVPPAVLKGSTCNLTYAGIQNVNINSGDTCKITGPGLNYNLSTTTDGFKKSPAINSSSRYTITCTNAVGTASKQTNCSLKPEFIEF